MSKLELKIEGDKAQELANKWSERFSRSLGARPEIRTPQIPRLRGVDPLTVASIILAIPPAVLATLELAKHFERRRQLAQLLQELREESLSSGIIIKIPRKEKPLELAQMSDSEIDQCIEELSKEKKDE